MDTARPNVTTCDYACGVRPAVEEQRSPTLLDKVLALAYGMFFVALAVAGSLRIVADLSAALIPRHAIY